MEPYHIDVCVSSAPECSEGQNGYVGQLFDVWSYGVCLLAYCQGKLPFYSDSELEYQMNAKNKKPEIPTTFSTQLTDLIIKLLEKDPTKRITLKEAEAHPWFK